MNYTKTAWQNDGPPAINATNLNKIEQGIKDASDSVNNLASLVTTADFSTSVTVGADSYTSATISGVSMAGYTLAGVIGVYKSGTGNSYIVLYNINSDDAAQTITIGMRNVSATARTITVEARALFIKNV